MDTWKQYLVLGFGLFTAGGFALQGISSYSSIVDTGPQQGQQDINTSLPVEHVSEGGFDRSPYEQQVIAYENDIVFVNSFYQTEEHKQFLLDELQGLPELFGNRVYVTVENESSGNQLVSEYGMTEFPSVVAIGGNQQNMPGPITDVTAETVSAEICNEFRSLGDQASVCLN